MNLNWRKRYGNYSASIHGSNWLVLFHETDSFANSFTLGTRLERRGCGLISSPSGTRLKANHLNVPLALLLLSRFENQRTDAERDILSLKYTTCSPSYVVIWFAVILRRHCSITTSQNVAVSNLIVIPSYSSLYAPYTFKTRRGIVIPAQPGFPTTFILTLLICVCHLCIMRHKWWCRLKSGLLAGSNQGWTLIIPSLLAAGS